MRYPKLNFFDGSMTRHIRVNRLSNYFISKLIASPYVMIEGQMHRQKIPTRVYTALLRAFNRRTGGAMKKTEDAIRRPVERVVKCSWCKHKVKAPVSAHACDSKTCHYENDCSNCAAASRILCKECTKQFWDDFHYGDAGPLGGITTFNCERVM